MSLFTTEVRYICERAAHYDESQGFAKVDDILKNVWDKVIPQGWEIFDEEYRGVLCQKILKHYYTREIGLETVGLWQLKLETKLGEIMPYYNELYRTKLFEFDPFKDVDYYRDHKGKGNSLSEGNREVNTTGTRGDVEHTENETNATEWNIYSDTPQGSLNNVEREEYLTNARKITDNRTGEQDTTRDTDTTSNSEETAQNEINTTDEYLDHIYGKFNSRSYMSLVREVRDNIINVDMMIIDDLKDLFMLLWR